MSRSPFTVPAVVLPLLGLLVTVLLLPGPADAAPAKAQTKAARAYSAQAHAATNAQRAAAGLPTLRRDRCLQTFAVAQARKMARRGALSHQSLGPVMKGCRLGTAGENVAMGFGSGTSVVDEGWMTSDGHRANILSTAYRGEAVAAVRDADGRWWVAQVFGRKR